MKTKIVYAILFLLTLASCQRQPEASFTMDKSQYTAGETIKLTNTSLDASSYLWTLPDGQQSTSRNLEYILPANYGNASLTFKLEAFSKNEKKSDEASQSVDVVAATGDVTFWQITNSGYGITVVNIDGNTSNITGEYGAAPSCGSPGCAQFHLTVGSYNFTATDGSVNWSGTINVTKDGCSVYQLQ